MENINKLLIQLDAKTRELFFCYAQVLKENEALKASIFLLEHDINVLKSNLEEKKNLLEDKSEDSIFASMLIDDLLEDLSHIKKTSVTLEKFDECKTE